MTQQTRFGRRSPNARIQDMLDHAQEAVAMARGRSRAHLDTDRMLELALTRLVELVGEAAWFVPDEFRAQHSQVPWRTIVATRNQLTHGYSSIDLDEVWSIIQNDLSPLISQLQAIITPPPPPQPASSAVG